jgi:hypothetical protein|tara:strand:- start:1148 stop:1441 length:294 start_codon:yes stop_codon:yes gene_type:complete
MAARRKAPRRRARKSFNVSAIEAGTALSLAQSTGFASSVQEALNGNIAGAINSMSSTIMQNKQKIIGTLGAAAVAKFASKGFASGTLAKLGPIRVKL